MAVTTVVNAPRTVITGINVIFVAIAHNVVQPNPSATGTVSVVNDKTAASSYMVNSSNNKNLDKPGSADICATSHLGNIDGNLGDK